MMAYLISKGSIDNFAVRPAVLTKAQESSLQKLLKTQWDLEHLNEIHRTVERLSDLPLEADTIIGEIFLKELTLRKNFEGTLANLFNPKHTKNEVYFLAWSWDLSGKKFYVYPSVDTKPDEWIKKMKKNDTAKFMHGDGLPIFPRGEIKGGVGVHIEVWESDKNMRLAGEKILKVKEALNGSDLTKIVTDLTAITLPTFDLIKKSVSVLSGIIGNILKKNGDDHIALFEGYFAVDKWKTGIERWKEPTENDPACEITIERN